MTEKNSTQYQVSSYRWVVLILYVFITMVTQIIWISLAPIDTQAGVYYHVSAGDIDLLAIIFMILYIPVNYPASWLIDKYGLRWGTGIGVILTGVFGFARVFAPNFTVLLIFQIMCGIGQPFVLNSATKCAAHWFPEREKTTATGIATMAMLLGIIVGMFTPTPLFQSLGMYNLMLIYGIISLVSMVLYIIFVKNKPEHPPNPYAEKTKVLALDGLKKCFKNRDFLILLVLLFIGLGSFNAISIEIQSIFARYSLGISGIIGGVMIIGGIIGAVVFSALSDKYHKRTIFLSIAFVSAAVLLPFIYFVGDLTIVLILDIIFGFLLVSALPVGLTYAAEITYPITEETSNGMLILMGQIGGIILVFPFYASITWSMIAIIILFGIGFIITLFLKDIKHYKLPGQTTQPTQSE